MIILLTDLGLSSVSIRTVLNYRTSNDSLHVRFEIKFIVADDNIIEQVLNYLDVNTTSYEE